MGQRLGIAAALLGDPGLLVLDEPANGLNPEGIVWLRTLIRSLAAEGPPACFTSSLSAAVTWAAETIVAARSGRWCYGR